MNMIDQQFGVSPHALSVRSQRFELISANLANADTPGYKAKDLEFSDALARAQDARDLPATTHPMHFDLGVGRAEALYRQPFQTSLDGNTVETQQEHAAFMDNAIRYQASLNFLDGRIKTLMLALRGE